MSRLPKIAQVFELVSRLPKSAQSAALQDACGSDLALLAEVRRLLDIACEGHATIVGGVSDEANLLIGKFKLLRTLGEGGFGVVYLGERIEPPFHRAAIKVLRSDRDSSADILRFQQEAELLTTFSHPNIARLLDVGETETGRPYLAMEYIDGRPIKEFCDRNNLTVEERLELFAPICEAMQHAHAHGVIHRDLKPANILVAEVPLSGDDAKKVRRIAKVIDFGVAKVLRGPTSAQRDRTIGGWVGSIEYMSPEQVEGRAGDLGPATDVYGLGAVLYELLVGRPPFTIEELKWRGDKEVLRVLREEERPKPSTRLHSDGDRIGEIAASRKTNPDQLSRTLRKRFLDQIVAKAMRVRQEDRYANAGMLRDDIQAFLDDRPLRCMSDYWWYEIRRVVRRHRAPFAVAAAIVITLSGSLVVMSSLWRRARAAEELANLQTQRVSDSLEQTQTLLNTVLMTSASSLIRADGSPEIRSDMTVGEYLDLLRSRIDSADLTPRTRADALEALARTHRWLGNIDQAMETITESVKVRRPLLEPESLELAEALQSVVETFLRGHASSRSHQQAAEAAGNEALAIREKRLGAEDPLTVRTRIDLEWVRAAPSQGHLSLFDPNVLALALLYCGDKTPVADAQSQVREVVQHVDQLWIANRREEAVRAIGDFLRRTCPRLDNEGRDRKAAIVLGIAQGIRWRSPFRGAAMATLDAAVRSAEEIHGLDSPRAFMAGYMRGDEMLDRGEFADAIAYLQPLLERASRVRGSNHADAVDCRTLILVCTVAERGLEASGANLSDPALLNLIAWRICKFHGRTRAQYQHALAAAERAIRIAPENSAVMHTLGVCQMRLGMLAEAESSLNTSLELRRSKGLAPTYEDHGYLAILHGLKGQPTKAAEHLQALRTIAAAPNADLGAVRLVLTVDEELARIRDPGARP